MTTHANKIAKTVKDAILADLWNSIDKNKGTRFINKCIPRVFVVSLAESVKSICPWMTRHTINNEYRRRVKRGIFICELGAHTTTTSAEDLASITLLAAPDSINRPKGGRPVQTSDKRKCNKSKAAISTKNEII